LSKQERSSTSLSIFSLNLAENYQPVIELYQTADHPALSPKSGGPKWWGEFSGFWITKWKTRLTWRGGGDTCMWFGLAHFHNGYSFLMISPNLLDIWPVFFLILSRCGTLHFFYSN
jgi:hypothetical protein